MGKEQESSVIFCTVQNAISDAFFSALEFLKMFLFNKVETHAR